jgi:hypothetical protein
VTIRYALLALVPPLAVSCGYHVGGKADLIPKGIQTVSIPAFTNMSTRYQLGDKLANQIGREFTTRTRFTVVNNPAEADAVLNGSVNSVLAYPIISDPTTGKATSVQMIVTLNVTLRERATGRVLYSRANLIVKGNYEIATDAHQFIDETGPSFTRLSESLAQDVVSAIVENF